MSEQQGPPSGPPMAMPPAAAAAQATAGETVTFTSTLAEAARLLHYAELETDLAKMERYEKLADSWIDIAMMLKPEDLP